MDTTSSLKRNRTSSTEDNAGIRDDDLEHQLKLKKGVKDKVTAEMADLAFETINSQTLYEVMKTMMLRLNTIGNTTAKTEENVDKALNSLQLDVDKLRDSNKDEIDKLKKTIRKIDRNNEMKLQEREAKYRSLKQETYSRKFNLIIEGLSEGGQKENQFTFKRVVERVFSQELGVEGVEIDVVHRIGQYVASRPRPVIVRFVKLADRQAVWSTKTLECSNQKGQRDNISLRQDIPIEAKKALDMLYRSLSAVKNTEKYKQAAVSDFKFILNGLSYHVDELELLPNELRPSTLATRSDNDTFVFLLKHTPLSNHFECQFKVEGIKYSTVEQFLARERAILARERAEVVDKIMMEHDPVQHKAYLTHMKKTDKTQGEWEQS